jgi:uncharacterized protein (TIGR02246 family)
MTHDEQAIREVFETWQRVAVAGDIDQLLPLMSEDAVFLTPGNQPMKGREAFAAAFQANIPKVGLESTGELEEVQVVGEVAYCRAHLVVTKTPIEGEGGAPTRLTGYTLTIFRKQSDGRWVLVRDANLLTPEPSTSS